MVGGSVTVWSGTVFDCPRSNNRIALLHSLFSGGDAGECSIPSGFIRAVSTSVDTSGAEDCYTSELSVNISANMDGETVVCTRDVTMIIGTDSMRVAGKQIMHAVMVVLYNYTSWLFLIIDHSPTSTSHQYDGYKG